MCIHVHVISVHAPYLNLDRNLPSLGWETSSYYIVVIIVTSIVPAYDPDSWFIEFNSAYHHTHTHIHTHTHTQHTHTHTLTHTNTTHTHKQIHSHTIYFVLTSSNGLEGYVAVNIGIVLKWCGMIETDDAFSHCVLQRAEKT